jgi:tripartite-type tricarboxylate transporter receptor subunit TctC
MRASALGSSLFACLLIGVASPATAQSVESFYRGKQIEILVGNAAGGGYDLYSRVLARHLGRHIPGNPGIVVKNVPGAGGLKLANDLFATTPRDGTSFGIYDRGVVIEPLLGNNGARFDATKYSPIGSIGKQVATCAAWYQAPVKTIQQALTTELMIGGTGPSATTTYPTLLNAVLKTRFKIISGYEGSSDIMLAIERGEVQGVCLSWPTLKSIKGEWTREKKLVPLVQISFKSDPELTGVPLVQDLAKSAEARDMLQFFFAPNEFGRPYLGPPGIPADRLQALRRAFDATMKDPEFLADAEKSQMDVDPMTGEDMAAMLKRIYAAPPAVIKGVADAMAVFRTAPN